MGWIKDITVIEEEKDNFDEIYALAKQGNVKAADQIGLWYLKMRLCDKAIFWLEKAATKGYSNSQLKLGSIYLGAYSEDFVDYEKAKYWFEIAAKKGNRKVMSNLASLYLMEFTKEDNLDKAYYWFRKCGRRHGYARYQCGKIFQIKGDTKNMVKEYKIARRYLKKDKRWCSVLCDINIQLAIIELDNPTKKNLKRARLYLDQCADVDRYMDAKNIALKRLYECEKQLLEEKKK